MGDSKKEIKRKFKVIEIYTILVMLATLFMSVAFAQVSDIKLKVTGNAEAEQQTGVFISDVTIAESAGVNLEERKYYRSTNLSTSIELSSSLSSYLTYNVSLYNNSGETYYFKGVSYDTAAYDNTKIAYVLDGIIPYQTTIGAQESLNFNLKFKYKEGITVTSAQTLNSILRFEFSSEMIEFTIANTKYTAPAGATWEAFINSSYNTYGFKVTNEKIYTKDGKQIYQSANEVKMTDLIKEKTVYNYKPELTLDKETLEVELPTGTTQTNTLTATLKNVTGDLKWSSSNKDIVTVSGSETTGTLTIKAEGTATITVSYESITATCNVIVTEKYVLELTGTTYGPATNYRIYGNTVQKGTPMPTAPVGIQSVGDKSKNLLPFPYKESRAEAEGTIIEAMADGGIKFGGTATGYNAIVLYNGPVLGSGKITLSAQGTFEHACLQILVSEGNTILFNKDRMTTSVTIDLNDYPTANKMMITAKRDVNDVLSGVIYPQLELGEVVTEYGINNKYKIPVKLSNSEGESTTTNIYLDEPLRKVGDYVDYIDFQNKKVVRNVKGITVDQNTKMSSSPYVYNNMNGVIFQYTLGQNYKRALGFCTHAEKIGLFTTSNSLWIGVDSPHIYWVGILDELGLTTIDEFKTWLSSNNVDICYQLAEPIEASIDLPELQLFNNYTKIEILTETSPSKVEAEQNENRS